MSVTRKKIAKYGWRRDSLDPRDLTWNEHNEVLEAARLPIQHSLRQEMPPIWDQGQLGSCTAHAVGAVMEHAQTQQGEAAVPPSRLYIYYEERVIEGTTNTDSGAEIRDGIKVCFSQGVPAETDWPYDINKFATPPPSVAITDASAHKALKYQNLRPGAGGAPIRTALQKSPIAFGFTVPDYFEGSWDPATEPLPLPDANTQYIGGHAVTMIGYDWSKKRFKVPVLEVRNSWGPDWGDAGHFYMDYRWADPWRNLTSDFWVITKTT